MFAPLVELVLLLTFYTPIGKSKKMDQASAATIALQQANIPIFINPYIPSD